MRWIGREGSGNVEDRRGMGGPIAIGGGIGTIAIVILSLLFGQNPLKYINLTQQPQQTEQLSEQQNQDAQFVSVVLKDTEDVWNSLFQNQLGATYREPKLVLFTGGVQSGCGNASAAVGPFYCPLDSKVYIDLSFYRDLKERFNAPGDFAMAYVVAHEVGHHVQNLLGISEKVHQAQQNMNQEEANALSVKLELQADFFAGVWAYHAQQMKNILEEGDIEEALNAANAIGDDKLQMQSQGYVVPDAFTHGSSKQRMYWFKRGFQTGDLNKGDTFNEENKQLIE